MADDLRHFAFSRLPEVLKRQTNNYTAMVSRTANALHEIAGARDGLAFLVRRIETEPGWFRLNNQDGWSQHAIRSGSGGPRSRTWARWRSRSWRSCSRNSAATCNRGSSGTASSIMTATTKDYYWGEKEADFARTAEEVWAEREQSGAACQYIAEYLYSGSGPLSAGDRDPPGRPSPRGARRGRAIEAGRIPAPAEPLRRNDPHPRTARPAPAGELAVSRLAHERLFQDGQTRAACQALERDARLFPQG